MRSTSFYCIGLLLLCLQATAIDTENTRLLQQPAISSSHIAFIYAEDLWVAAKDGSNPRRLTVDEGVESTPVFSPDGSMIAFNAQYDGNNDVYVIPVAGGIPRRLTWHPGPDLVRDWSPDGKTILFASQRNSFTSRYHQLYTVHVATGQEVQLPIPNAFWACYSPDGSHIAYTPLYDAFNQWKHYRGGTQSRIWLYNTKTHAVTQVPKPAAGSNDTKPQWRGNKLFFRSDRNGEFNLYSYDVNTKNVEQHTRFSDFPVLWLTASATDVIFEQAGYLHTMPLSGGGSKPVKVGIAADLLDRRPRYISGDEYLRSGHISPSGARIVVDFRGDIITLPAQKGDPLNLTNPPGTHEKFPAWSPDGRSIAYFSDAGGEYALHIAPQDASAPARVIKLNGTGFYAHLHWAPNSKQLCYVDNGRNLYMMEVATGKITKIAQDTRYIPGSFRPMFGSWAANSQYLAYTIITNTQFEQAYVYSLADGKSYPVSDGLSNVTEPIFDPSGKYLYMLASTDAGPVVNWFDQSNQDMRATNTIYLLTLQNELPSPLARENEVEEIKDTTKAAAKKDEKTNATIDWEGMANRIISLPVPKGNYFNLAAAKEGEIYYLSSNESGNSMLHQYQLKKRKEETIMPAEAFMLNAKGDKMLFYTKGKWGIVAPGQKPTGEAMINTAALSVKTEPTDEWNNIFEEAWRVNRDYFYDPNMPGANWASIKTQYAAFLP
ncbi:MAG TPA: hypothetical protein PKD90_04635, partial [Phnomibacter sp.]|nr:hypothetical protein [Phnomibacter sp.]